MKPQANIDLSLIVPAYNCPTIDSDLIKINTFLRSLKLNYEIICVVDGLKNANDQTLKKANSPRLSKLRIFFYPQNQGKGFAVRYGFKQAAGQLIGFFDAGSDLDVNNLADALNTLKLDNADIVIGSKRHPFSRINKAPTKRRLFSNLSQLTTKFVFGLPITDTQVGLKIFKAKVLKKLISFFTINGFAFDIELLAVAKRLNYKISESPVQVTYNTQSTIRLKSIINFAFDSIKIAYRLHFSNFYPKK